MMDYKKENLIIQKLIERFGFDQVCEGIREIDPYALSLPVSIETTISQEYLFPDSDKSIDQIFAELDEFFGITQDIIEPRFCPKDRPLPADIATSWNEKDLEPRNISHHQSNPAIAA